MKKDIRIFAIPTKNASCIKFIPKGEYDEIDGKLVQTTSDRYLYVGEATKFGYPSTFLYAITDETIKERDWVICSDYKGSYYELGQVSHIGQPFSFKNTLQIGGNSDLHIERHVLDYCRKVVATTNNNISLNLGKEYHESPIRGGQMYTRLCPLPQISPEFQQAWVKSMNDNVPIVDALIEIEEGCQVCDNCNSLYSTFGDGIKCDVCRKFSKINYVQSKPKINSQGYVTILPKQEDIEQLLEPFILDNGDLYCHNTPFLIKKLKAVLNKSILPKVEKIYSREEVLTYGKLAFEVGRNFQLTGENNLSEIEQNLNN